MVFFALVAPEGSYSLIVHLNYTVQHAALCSAKPHCHPHSLSFLCVCSILWQKDREKREEVGEDLRFEASGFVSKPSMVWLSYKRTCLITSLSRACQRLHPKNKTWHIKKNTICFEWWQSLFSASSPVCVGGGPEVTTSTPFLLNLPVPLTPGPTLCHGPPGTIIQNQGPVSVWTL